MNKNNKKALKSLGILSAIFGCIYGINRLVFFVSTMKEILVSEEKSFYHWRFGNIYYSQQGKGKPILLIHDLEASCSDFEWRGLKEQLASERTVYTIDLPGYGRSDKEHMHYTNYLYVQAVNDFVKHIIKGKTDVISSGNASSIAIMACHSEPTLYGKLIFINPETMKHMRKIPRARQKMLYGLFQTPVIGTLMFVLTHSKFCIRKKFAKEYFYNKEKIDSNVINAFYEAAHLGGFRARFAYASQIACYTRMNVVHVLKKMDHSLYIIGGAECKNMQETIDEYQNINPAIEASVMDEAKGMPHMEYPLETVDVCKLFLND